MPQKADPACEGHRHPGDRAQKGDLCMQKKTAILYAILAAFCYGVSTPASKALLEKIPPAMLAALLYLGAGLGMGDIGTDPQGVWRGGGVRRG